MLLQWLGWACFFVASGLFLALYRHSQMERLHLNYYVVYLLVSDDIRSAQRQSFFELLQASDATNADALAIGAFNAMESVADRLAAGNPNTGSSSALGARALLWETAETLRRLRKTDPVRTPA